MVKRNLPAAKLSNDSVTLKSLKRIDPSLRGDVQEALVRFAINPLDPKLNFEAAKGRIGLYSIRANYYLRIYFFSLQNDLYQIIHIGNHDFYKRLK